MIEDFVTEYARYRTIGERALEQLPDAALNRIDAPDGNSAAMIVRHLSGNLVSRFTDFLTTDGEKPWRDRETRSSRSANTPGQKWTSSGAPDGRCSKPRWRGSAMPISLAPSPSGISR